MNVCIKLELLRWWLCRPLVGTTKSLIFEGRLLVLLLLLFWLVSLLVPSTTSSLLGVAPLIVIIEWFIIAKLMGLLLLRGRVITLLLLGSTVIKVACGLRRVTCIRCGCCEGHARWVKFGNRSGCGKWVEHTSSYVESSLRILTFGTIERELFYICRLRGGWGLTFWGRKFGVFALT